MFVARGRWRCQGKGLVDLTVDAGPGTSAFSLNLARSCGCTEEDLDFTIDYNIKYRMGDALGAERAGRGTR